MVAELRNIEKISKLSYFVPSSQYNQLWLSSATIKAMKLRKSIAYAKSAYFMKLGLYHSS